MLSPDDRTLLLESLRPPDGYVLDRAVGTSYSLDLLALLTAPLAFTFFDWEDEDGRPTADPLALLEAVRRNAEKIVLFCQAGEVRPPPPASSLIAYLCDSVIRVNAPNKEGVFHPKVWCLRFTAANQPTKYRLLVLSRNLTFDRSWDTVLRLDGELKDRVKGYASNRALGEFIAGLPGLAVTPVAPALAAELDIMASELRRVEFELPAGVDEIAFWPLGLSTQRQRVFTSDARRMLVMSPFLSASRLDECVDGLERCVLISRPDQLAAMPAETLGKFEQVFALNPAVDAWADTDEVTADAGLNGLHAKLFIEEEGRQARMYTGSANATEAAFGRNVEFLVELVGRKSVLGIDAMMDAAANGRTSLMSLLQRWSASPEPTKADAATRALDLKLAHARRAIASADLRLEASPEGDAYRLTLVAGAPLEVDAAVAIRCWPAFLRAEQGLDIANRQGPLASFPGLPLAGLDGFVVCEVTASASGLTGATQFAFNPPMTGAPPDRLRRLLASSLKDKDHVRRLLWLLLEGHKTGVIGAFQDPDRAYGSRRARSAVYDNPALFEQFVLALADNRSSLDSIGRLIDDLASTPDGKALLPDGLLELWTAVKGAMETHDG